MLTIDDKTLKNYRTFREKSINYPAQPYNSPIKKDKDGNTYIIKEKYSFRNKKISLFVKSGFKYDGASVPRWAWTITRLRPDGLLRSGALIHDCLYLANGEDHGNFLIDDKDFVLIIHGQEKITRKEADKIFKKILIESGVKKWRARLAYTGVRIGGAFLRRF